MPQEGLLFILVGPSGAGKNTLMKRVQEQIPDLPQLATATTRPKRADEQEGREHRFVSREEFERLIAADALIEYQKVHRGDYYGTPRDTVERAFRSGQDLIADIDFLGAQKIHAAYPHNTVLIFVTPAHMHTLTERIQQRGELSAGELETRLARARFEMTFATQCNYIVLNDLLEPATEHLRQIIITERARRRPNVQVDFPLLHRPVLHGHVVALVSNEDKVLVRADTPRVEFPTYPLTDPQATPAEALKGHLAALHEAISIDTLYDERFDFPAPHLSAVAVIPNAAYLYFYYRCLAFRPLEIAGWAWRPVADLPLSADVRRVVQGDDL